MRQKKEIERYSWTDEDALGELRRIMIVLAAELGWCCHSCKSTRNLEPHYKQPAWRASCLQQACNCHSSVLQETARRFIRLCTDCHKALHDKLRAKRVAARRPKKRASQLVLADIVWPVVTHEDLWRRVRRSDVYYAKR